MINAIFASAALLASATLANAAGSAVVVNQCDYAVTLTNVPAAGGGQSQVGPQSLSTGGTYSQQFTELSNGMGWSLKLSKDASLSNIMQYEYTFHNDGTIWYDLSDVNGNPWDGNWEITASGDCTPKQSAYRFSTDDAYGMQSCPDQSTITVTLCSGTSGGSSGSGGSSPPAPAQSSWAAKSVAPVPSPSTPAASPSQPAWSPPAGADKVAAVSQAGGPAGVTITNVHTEVVTEYVTATGAPEKRHEHLHRHAHHHNRL